jgi:hypothetical protein
MRQSAWLAVVLVALSGCGPEGKKAGEAKDRAKGSAKPALTLVGPAEPVEILNGKQATLNVKVQWAGSAREELQLTVTVSSADRGVTAQVQPGRLKREEEQAAVTVTVGEAAASGDYKVKLTTRVASAGEGVTLPSRFEASWEGTVRVPKKE